MTDAQHHLLGAMDDAIEHIAWELDPDRFDGISTCGFASIIGIDGRSSFVRRFRSLAEDDRFPDFKVGRNDDLRFEIGDGYWRITLHKDSYRGGYRLSVSNQPLVKGANIQRMDFQERIHDLLLERLKYEWGYIEDARRTSRMD